VALGGPRSGEIPNLDGSPAWLSLGPIRAKRGYLGLARAAGEAGRRQGLQERSDEGPRACTVQNR